MARDTEYRWANPRKAVEYGVDRYLQHDFEDSIRWLRTQIMAGAIRVKLDGIEIAPSIAKYILRLFDLEHPDETIVLPSNFLLHMPDVRRVAAKKQSAPAMRRGRPKGAGSFADVDRPLVQRMNMLIQTGVVRSPNAAAAKLVAEGEVEGQSDDSKKQRLVKRYKQSFGDDR